MTAAPQLNLSDNALAVLKRRYLAKDNQGRVIETAEQLFWRVARFIAEGDRAYGASDEEVEGLAAEFYALMARREFMPNSPTLMNAGRPLGQLSACFVLPVGDSMEEIFQAIKDSALIHKSGGGTGFSFSRLRPRHSVVASTQGVASGPVSFMRVFNAATEAVKQGGTRRGANMGILRVDHPDILEFIACKDDVGEITNFNISVAITEEFMQALADSGRYPLRNPATGRIHQDDSGEVRLEAKEVFDQIVQRAWATGEPGMVFIDRMNQTNPTHPEEVIEATNPCGEQPLPAYDSCNLGSLNLGLFVVDPLPDDYLPSRPEEGVAWDRLAGAIGTAVHFLDNVIDQNRYPLPQIEEQSRKNRRIGLGVMGWADLLVKLGLPYDSPEALGLAEKVMEFVQTRARNHSSQLAKSRGVFQAWETSVYARENTAMRNATVTTIAPTGTISIIAGCSSGIEPYYALAFERNVLDGSRLVEVNELLLETSRREGFYSKELVERLSAGRSIKRFGDLPERVRAIFLTAADISPADHVRMQAAFQRHTDSAVSKTINFAEDATREQVAEAFRLAHELGCKGITVYRDGSRPHQVLSSSGSAEAETPSGRVADRPKALTGVTERIRTGYGNLYVTVNFLDGRPFEVFAQIGHSGYTTMADTEAICRLVSLALRAGVEVGQIVRQLRGIGGSSQVFSDGAKVTSLPDAIAQVLARQAGLVEGSSEETASVEICPDCGSPTRLQSGCLNCPACGYSTC